MGNTSSPVLPFAPSRAYPRVKYATPILIEMSHRTLMGATEDVALGGLAARCEESPRPDAKLGLLFNLPTGSSVRSVGVVRYVLPGRFGVQFTDLPLDSRQALEEYTRATLGQLRRGGRIAKRLHITLRSMTSHDTTEQAAETVILSRNGGHAVCRAHFMIGEELRLYWAEEQRAAQIRVVGRKLCGTGELTDIDFVFHEDENFWGLEFPS